MIKSDWILIVLAIGKSLSPVQLQKSLFLVSKELMEKQERNFYDFAPYDYGPFNSGIYTDAVILAKEGLIHIENPLERSVRKYCITEEGSIKAQEYTSSIGTHEYNKVREIVTIVKSLSFSSLVKMIYDKYPEYKVNSIFQ